MNATVEKTNMKQVGNRFVITYAGYVDDSADDVLKEVEARILRRPQMSSILFVQAEGFSGFHRTQVTKHAQAIGRMKHKLTGVAIANATGAVRFAIASVSMLVRAPLKGFDSVDAANAWLDAQAAQSDK